MAIPETPPLFRLDRRPRAINTITSGPTTTDPLDLGRDTDYLRRGLPGIIYGSLFRKYLAGFEIFDLHMPQGAPRNQIYTSALWQLLNTRDRNFFSTLPSWITELDIYVGAFTGSTSDPFTYDMTQSGQHIPNPTTALDSNFLKHTWTPLLQSLLRNTHNITLNTVWLDTGSADPDGLATLFHNNHSFRVGGEALPLLDIGPGGAPGGRSYIPHPDHILKVPWFTDLNFFRAFSVGNTWEVDPDVTEVHVAILPAFLHSPAVTLAEIEDLITAGFIVDDFSGASDSQITDWIADAHNLTPP